MKKILSDIIPQIVDKKLGRRKTFIFPYINGNDHVCHYTVRSINKLTANKNQSSNQHISGVEIMVLLLSTTDLFFDYLESW